MITRRECALAAAAALAGFLGGAASTWVRPVYAQEHNWPKTVTARELVVVDGAGARRVEIGVDAYGQGSLHIYDEHGRLAFSAPDLHVWPAAAPPHP